MPYIYFTDEQKQRANSVDLVDYLIRRGEKLIPSGRDKRLASDHSITVRGNEWYDHATERGGGAISFVQHFYGLKYPEAVTHLLGGEQGVTYNQAEKQKEPKKFTLPPANPTMRRVYAYLLKQRFIDRDVLNTFVHAILIYESCEQSKDKTREYHNAIFVGCDENDVPRHAHQRSIYTGGKSYRGNIAGCDPRYSFHWIGKSDRLYVFEAPIDLLSYITLYPEEWQKHSYVALCGTAEHAMLWMLGQNQTLQKVFLCLDHDEAGIEATARLAEILTNAGYHEVYPDVSEYKDWNADLKARHGQPAESAEEHPQLVAAVPICERIGALCSESKPEKAARLIPALLQTCRSHLHERRFDEAMACMETAAALALAAALQECHQLGKNVSPKRGAQILQSKILPHQNRSTLKNRPEEIAVKLKSVLAKSQAAGIRTIDEKKQLAGAWMDLAVSCAKMPVRYEADCMKQQQKEEAQQETGLAMQ